MSVSAIPDLHCVDSGVYLGGTVVHSVTLSGSGNKAMAAILPTADLTGVGGTITYRVQVDTGSGYGSDVVIGSGTPIAQFFQLTPGASVTFRARVESTTDGNGAYSSGLAVTLGNVPASPADLPQTSPITATGISSTGLTLNWDAFGFAGGGTITYSQVLISDGTGVVQTLNLPVMTNGVAVTGLTAGINYTAQLINFAVVASGTYTFQCAFADFSVYTADDTAPISGPATVYGYKGAPLVGEWTWIGSHAVVAWAVAAGSTGLSMETLGLTNGIGRLRGTPTVGGIFTVILAVTYATGATTTAVAYFPVKVAITGDGCLGWLHDSPERSDLAIEIHSGFVDSFNTTSLGPSGASGGASGSSIIAVTRGDTQRFYVVFVDQGGNLQTPTIAAISMTVRLPDQPDGMLIWNEFDASPNTETVNGHATIYFDVLVKSDFVDAIFNALNAAAGGDSTSNILACVGEISWKIGSKWRTSRTFGILVYEDYDR